MISSPWQQKENILSFEYNVHSATIIDFEEPVFIVCFGPALMF